MLHPAKLIKFLLTVLAMYIGLYSNASHEKYINQANGDQLPVDSLVAIKDTGFSFYGTQIEADYLRQNVISVFFNEKLQQLAPSPFTAKVYVQYSFENYLHQVSSLTVDSFVIRYDSVRSFGVRDYRVFNNIFASKVKITGITSDVSWDVRKFISISNEIYINRAYRWDNCSTTKVASLQHTVLENQVNNENTQDRFRVSWSDVLGADEYDLEWTYQDADINGNLPTPSAAVFTNGATRISTDSLCYRIPLLYDGMGRVHYRVRPVKIKPDGQRIEGQWSSDASALGSHYADFGGFQKKLNWQSTISFAEEGKNKTVVNYFDGSLRSRQTVTRDNTTDTAIVAETFYDFQGRAAVQVLPSPTLSSLVVYAKDFNRSSINNAAYETDDFDKLSISEPACGKAANSMSSSTSGAANYYSPSNPLLNRPVPGFNRFIPDAQNYPFTQTEYTLDNTGRISRQGGVGRMHQLGKRDTRYYYGKPSQEELDGLFGTEVGYAGHYFKNMVRDANGQYSISYVDMHGRTIATSLAGTTPDSIKLEKLGSNNETDVIYESLIEPNSQIIDGYSIKTSKGLVVPKSGDYTLAYQLKAPRLTVKDCDSIEICYDCLYDLNIKVINDCGDTYLDVTVPKIGIDTTTIPSGIDAVCNGQDSSQYTNTLNLAEGSYMISKTLTIRKESLDEYRDSIFMKRNLCKTYQSFLQEAIQEVQIDANCVPTCEACSTALGTKEVFIGRYMEQMGIAAIDSASHHTAAAAAYTSAKNTCDKLCSDILGDNDAIRQEMLQDMTPPYGQYARNDSAYRVADNLNIFYLNGNQQRFQASNILYKDENGIPDTVANSQGMRVLPNQLTEEEFVSLFKPSWAEALLQTLHPERNKLNLVTQWAASYQYDEKLKAVDTYAEALSKGYLNPTGDPSLKLQFNPGGTNPNSVDPALGLPIFSSSNALWNAINNYRFNPNNGALVNIWSLAYIMVVCENYDQATNTPSNCTSFTSISNTFSTSCTGDLDMAWRNFRELYLQVKAKLIFERLTTHITSSPFEPRPFTPSGGVAYDRYTTNFPNPATTGGIAGIDPTSGTSETVETQLSGHQIQELVAANCNGYVDTWMQKLSACQYTNDQWSVLKTRLLEACKGGGDVSHIQGASTTRPGYFPQTSFVAVVANFNQENSITTNAACNGYLLTTPAPYEAPITTQVNQVVYNTASSPCLCSNLSRYHSEYLHNSPGGETFGAYLRRTQQISTSDNDIDLLYNQCTSSTNFSGCHYFATPITIPPALSICVDSNYVLPCTNCGRADGLFQQFKLENPSIIVTREEVDSAQQVNNRFFSNYMNYYTGFNYTHIEYLDFLDSCQLYGQLSDTACKSFTNLIKDYKKGLDKDNCATIKWKMQEPFTTNVVAPACTGISNGTLHIPPNLTQGGPIDISYIDSNFCVPNEFAVDFKIRVPNSTAPYNVSIGIVYQDEHGIDIPYKNFSLDLPSSQYASYANYWINYAGTSYPDVALDLTNWHVLRLQKTSDSYKYYVDGECKLTVPVPADHVGLRHMRTGVLVWNTPGGFEMDWMRIFNSLVDVPIHGIPIYDEQFNNDTSFAKVDRRFVCSSNCQNEFAGYYNKVKGTSLTFTQISALYQQSCGKQLNVCNEPSSCDTLTKLKDAFPEWYSSVQDANVNTSGAFGLSGWSLTMQRPWWYHDPHFYYEVYRDIKPIVANGIATMPQDYYNVLANAAFGFHSERNFCLNNAYTVEWRAKNNHILPNGTEIMGRSYNQGLPGFAYEVLKEGGAYHLWCRNGVNEYWTTLSSLPNYNDWVTVKIEMATDSIRFYWDGEIIWRKERLDYSWVGNFNEFGLTMNLGYQKQLDWYKVYDSNGSLVFFEDFEPTGSFVSPSALCPLNGCQSDFTFYFNEKNYTSGISSSMIEQKYIQACGSFSSPCSTNTKELTLCGRSNALFPDAEPGHTTDCYDTTQLAIIKATIRYNVYRDSLLNTFDSVYLKKCLTAVNFEQLHLTRPNNEYHYTLYYYDQAGNLVKTVPPAGVYRFKSADSLAMVQNARNTSTSIVPPHGLATTYRYNSLNQVVVQQTSDAGVSKFWYDLLGRLTISQNAKQKTGITTDTSIKMYSYTLYDAIGRISEVGELLTKAIQPDQKTVMRNPTALAGWLNSYTTASPALYRRQITRTIYDIGQSGGQLPVSAWFSQKNLRNRVSYSQVIDQDAAPIPSNLNGTTTGIARAATYYSYDVHGNVYKLLQHYNSGVMKNNPASNINQFKLVEYDYDLISGKVNMVSYQPSYVYNNNLVVFPDRFYHKYDYDGENRLTHVYTSPDSVYWELDARYDYYRHGPLARMVLGHQQVQGVDYAYTLQGWLKGVNGISAPVAGDVSDMGGDAATGNSVAMDAYSFSLHYHNQDYAPIGGSNAQVFAAVGTNELGGEYRPLYNGNISSMAVNVPALGTGSAKLYNYQYDQLNRIVKMDAWSGLNTGTNSWAGAVKGDAYKEQVSYDPNGNILKYFRNGSRSSGSAAPVAMDDMTYHYYTGTNRLRRVTDLVSSANFSTDIDNQTETDNYIYDAIGNLITDKSERLKMVDWNVYGKILSVEKGTSSTTLNNTRIYYTYDAAGNRISKQVQRPGQQGVDGVSTWYVRDAQGNVMSTYTFGNTDVNEGVLTQSEVHLYGSSRLGMWKPNRNVQTTYSEPLTSVNIQGTLFFGNIRSFKRGNKLYELSNHLGNVLATISDKKFGVAGSGSSVSYYKPDVVNATDYYPFGMTMPGRGSSDLESAATPDNPTGRIRIEAESFSFNHGATTGTSGDVDGSMYVGGMETGEYVDYEVDVPVSGTYVLNFRVATEYNSQFQLRNAATNAVLTTVNVPNTSWWQTYTLVTTTAQLEKGLQVLRIYTTQPYFQLNWWELTPPGTKSGTNINTSTYHVEAEDYISQKNLQIEDCIDAGGTKTMVYGQGGSWSDYRITVPMAGTYSVKLRVSSNGYGILKLLNVSGTDLASTSLPSTGSTYTTVTLPVSLSGGTQTVRVYCHGATFNLNWLEIVTPPGLTNYALTLNNTSNGSSNGLMYDAENNFTMEFWVKPSGTHEIDSEGNSGTDGLSGQHYVFFPASGGDGYGSKAGVGISVGTNGVSVYEHADNHMPATLVWTSPTPLSDWTHVAVVYTNRLATLYINGVAVRTGVLSGRNHLFPSLNFPGGHLGNAPNSQLDEVRIWKVARSQAEIQEHMGGEIAATSTGLVGYWPMNEGSGTVLHDVSGNGRDIDLSTAGYNSGNTNWTIGRNISTNQADKYRYAFNGKELDTDLGQDDYDYGMRIHDARLGRFLSVDPLTKSFPHLTPYQFASNMPIAGIDMDGLEFVLTIYNPALANKFSLAVNDFKDIYMARRTAYDAINSDMTQKDYDNLLKAETFPGNDGHEIKYMRADLKNATLEYDKSAPQGLTVHMNRGQGGTGEDYSQVWHQTLFFKEYGNHGKYGDDSPMSESRDDGYPVDVRMINSPLYSNYYSKYDFIGHFKSMGGSATYGGGVQAISGHLKGYGRVDYTSQFIGPSTPGVSFERGMLTGNFNTKNTSDFSPSTLAGYGGSVTYGAGIASTGSWYSFSSYADMKNFNIGKAPISGEQNSWTFGKSFFLYSYSKSFSFTTLNQAPVQAPSSSTTPAQ